MFSQHFKARAAECNHHTQILLYFLIVSLVYFNCAQYILDHCYILLFLISYALFIPSVARNVSSGNTNFLPRINKVL